MTIANIMGTLAKIEHQQKLDWIQSGVHAAQHSGKWTGRPPREITVGNDKHLHVNPGESLENGSRAARANTRLGV